MDRAEVIGVLERDHRLEELVRSWFHGASTGDPALIDRHVSRDPGTRLIGSDPGERLSGGDEIAAFLRGEVEGGGGAATFTPANTEAFSEGGVGWATTDLTSPCPTAGLSPLDGARSSTRKTGSGASCRPTHRSAYPTKRWAGSTPRASSVRVALAPRRGSGGGPRAHP